MSASVIISEPTPAQVTIGIPANPQINLDGGVSSLTIEQTGTTVQIAGEVGFTWSSPSALQTWLVSHNLGRFPVASIRDSYGAVVAADITHLDENVLTINFSAPVQGSVDLA